MVNLPRLYTSEEVADLLGVTVGTFAQWRHRNKAPKHLKINGSVRYTAESVLDWLREQNPGQITEQEHRDRQASEVVETAV